jgi:SAM-dependent methyltransferase
MAHGSRAACLLCGSTEIAEPVAINDGWQMRVCRRCEAGTTWPIPTDAEMLSVNIEEYPVRERVGMYRSRASEFRARWDQLLEFLPPEPASVLDVGCNLGFFLDHMRERGIPRVAGAEINDECRAWGTSSLGLDIRRSIDDFGEERFDVVLLQDVLEHLKDPMGFLRHCRTKLTADGVILIQLPNRCSRMAREAGTSWEWYSAPDHLVHLTPRSLSYLAETADLRVQAMRSADAPVDLSVALHPWLPARVIRSLRHVRGFQRLRIRPGDEGGLLQALLTSRNRQLSGRPFASDPGA